MFSLHYLRPRRLFGMVESGLGPKERVRQRLRTGADYTESKMRMYLTKKLLSRCHSQRKDSLAPK